MLFFFLLLMAEIPHDLGRMGSCVGFLQMDMSICCLGGIASTAKWRET